ncbi:FecR family protein [Algihabitans sp.]|uniref:FecR family protein n=1 Tax=Algihabitans sp. TaxID=2821514 RepID=UPI003BAB290E
MTDWDRALREAVNWSILLDEDPEDRDVRAQVAAWRREDPLHDRAWNETVSASRLIADTKHVTSHQRAHSQAYRIANKKKIQSRVGALAGLAAAVALVWLAGPHILLSLTADHVTGTAEQRTVALPDGSNVRLAPASALSFNDAEDAREARIIAGEAYFEVARDPQRPFTVVLEQATVTVVGTAFNVRLGAETTTVGVKHGSVQVDARDGNEETVILEAGRWAEISDDGRIASGSRDPGQVGGWTGQRIIAVDRRLSEVVADLRRYYSGVIVLTGESLAQRSVTGVFDASDPVAAARIIVQPHGGSVRQITPWLLMISPS